MSNPARPVDISGTRAGTSSAVGTPGRGIADSLRAQYAGITPPPNIPPRLGTPRPNDSQAGISIQAGSSVLPSSPVGGISAARPETPDSGEGSSQNANADENIPEDEKLKVVRRHLVSREEREGGTPGSSSGTPSRRPSVSQPKPVREDSDAFPVPFHAPGADVIHDVYKWQQNQHRQARPRAASFAGSTATGQDPAFEHIHEPGGFRRNYLLLQGSEQPEESRMLNSFIDFLYIFGHFAGEDLEEIEEEDEEEYDDEATAVDEQAPPGSSFIPSTSRDGVLRVEPLPSTLSVRISAQEHGLSERSPLLARSKSRSASRRRRLSSADHGTHGSATVGQAILMLLKAFVGTGVLFLGKAFFNGGLLFSTLTIAAIALISLYSFLLLVKTKFVVSGSFGDIGGALYGPWMRYTILSSITLSQIGFVCAYTIFVSENIQSFIMAVSNCTRFVSTSYLILAQLIIFLPLALIRDIAKLSTAVLVADAFILFGLIYVFGSEVAIVARRGIADIALFNPKDFSLMIGTAVFSFEGIGLVIPITDAMREPHKFPAVLSGVMITLLFLFGGAGAMAYLAFGSEIKTVVIVNLDTTSRLTQTVQLFYSLAILLSVPLQLFPAVRIMENGIFTSSGKTSTRVKWQKNVFRFLVVMGCTLISWLGAGDLDKFVAFVGSFACVPLCFCYPAMLHYRACARTWQQKAADIALTIFGIVAAAYTTIQTISLMAAPEPPSTPIFGCKSIYP